MRAAVVQSRSSEVLQKQRILDVLVFDREFPTGWHHSDNRMTSRREHDLLSDYLRVAAEGAFPKRVSQDYDAVRFIFRVLLGKAASQQRRHSENVKDLRGDGDALEILSVIGQG